MDRRIQNRIFFLIAVIGILMLTGILVFRQVEHRRVQYLLEGELHRNSEQLNLITDFKSKSLADFAVDYTYWDDMVNFTRTRDADWARDNIQISLATFGIDYAWVYDTDINLIYGTCRDELRPIDSMPLLTKEISLLVDTARLYDFFIQTGDGLMQVSGGSIHPTNDPERKTNPAGYLFVGRIWSENYLRELEAFSGTEISVITKRKLRILTDSVYPRDFVLVNFKPLDGWNHYTTAYLRSAGIMDTARDFQLQSTHGQLILAVVLILLLALFSTVLIRMINHPLRELVSALIAGTSEPIGKLAESKSEFGRIAHLIGEFFVQKKALESEIQERMIVEQELIVALDKAEESDRLKTAFLNNISHEIRTPMNAIVGFSELIANQRITEAERNEFVGIIQDSSNRLLNIITDLINISTIQSGQEVVKEDRFNLNELLTGVMSQVIRDIDPVRVTLILDAALRDEHSMILSDRTKLEQILLNLLRNAVKFTDSGRIDFGYMIRTNEIEFFVKDTGIGISEEKFNTIFARFEQADDKLSREYGGTGLGLPISKAYAELLGGRLWFNSTLGKGTEFFFCLFFPAFIPITGSGNNTIIFAKQAVPCLF